MAAQILPRFDFRADFAVARDKGSRRTSYEDAALVAPEIAVFAVADGMGGHQAGEVAAKLAIDSVRRVLGGRDAQRVIETYVGRPDLDSRRAVFACLRRAFETANRDVRDDAAKDSSHGGMGTTLDLVWLARDHAFVAHAGDGRVYLARSRAMLQLTQDHALLANLRTTPGGTPPRGSGLTNAIGLSDALTVDTLFVDLGRGDRLLVCSDGVHGQVEGEAELAELLRSGAPEHSSRALVARAGEHGRDNATAVVIEVGERFVKRTDRDRGLAAADLERARQSPLLVDLPQSFALNALSVAVDVYMRISGLDIHPDPAGALSLTFAGTPPSGLSRSGGWCSTGGGKARGCSRRWSVRVATCLVTRAPITTVPHLASRASSWTSTGPFARRRSSMTASCFVDSLTGLGHSASGRSSTKAFSRVPL